MCAYDCALLSVFLLHLSLAFPSSTLFVYPTSEVFCLFVLVLFVCFTKATTLLQNVLELYGDREPSESLIREGNDFCSYAVAVMSCMCSEASTNTTSFWILVTLMALLVKTNNSVLFHPHQIHCCSCFSTQKHCHFLPAIDHF